MQRGIVLVLTVIALTLGNVKGADSYEVPIHQALVDDAIAQLYADANRAFKGGNDSVGETLQDSADFWAYYEPQLVQGVTDADYNPLSLDPPSWSVHHGWNPETGKGWLGNAGSVEYANDYEGHALSEFLSYHNLERMAWNIGAAIHLIQDETVPHHVMCRLGDGHAKYEAACTRYRGLVNTKAPGVYEFPGYTADVLVERQVGLWIVYAATQAGPLYAKVGPNTKAARKNDRVVASKMMNLASRLTAGYLYCLYRFLAQQEPWTN